MLFNPIDECFFNNLEKKSCRGKLEILYFIKNTSVYDRK